MAVLVGGEDMVGVELEWCPVPDLDGSLAGQTVGVREDHVPGPIGQVLVDRVLMETTDNEVDILVLSGDPSHEQIDRPAPRQAPGHG